jgi:hypothetical protein
MGRPGCGITDSAVEAQAQAMISQLQRVSCSRRERAVRRRRVAAAAAQVGGVRCGRTGLPGK